MSMIEVPCTAEEVHKLLTTCKAKTSSGPDGISSAMLRNTADAIALRLTALSSQQFGFRSGFSSQEALLTVTNDWHNILATNRQATAVFFGIRKAFDSLPHHHILTSLSSLGVSGPHLAWFSNYLTDSQQRVVLDGVGCF